TLYDNENESSDREVSPKFVVGSKKYGRRSRPREDCNGLDTSSDFSNSDNESVPQQQLYLNMKSITAEWTTEIGSLSTAIIIDMWESAGISEPRTLLQDLGFYGLEVQVTELIAALEDEQQRLGDGNDTSVVVRASLALHKAEVSALRQAFLQLMEENKKLYSDNKEANQRAQLLLQEVDERHNSLESATRDKIRLLEQRHHETVKELTSQLAFEREQLSCANATLEKRIQSLEQDESKVKAEMNSLLEENEGLRAEQENLTKELTDILEKNIKLNRDIAELEENNRNDFDDEYAGKNDLEVLELIEKNSLLQDKNKELKDKNDELSVEIEMLNAELAKFKLKRSGVSRTSSLDVSPNTSAARKRQGDSPSKARLSDESPRLGKFRKCSNDVENESDSSGDWMALHSELGLKVEATSEEIQQLKTKIAELEELNKKKEEESTVKARCEELEASLEQLSKEYEACEDYWQSKVNEERLLYEEEQRIADEKLNELCKKVAEYEEQFAGQGGNKNDDGRLSPIEEKDVLEQQYLDLEVEFQQVQTMLQEKTHELEKLRGRILELEQLVKYPSEALLATPPRVDTPEMESPASSPISYLWNQSTIQAPA
ncbi:AAEL014969-PA, partial [Aedes aegypti]